MLVILCSAKPDGAAWRKANRGADRWASNEKALSRTDLRFVPFSGDCVDLSVTVVTGGLGGGQERSSGGFLTRCEREKEGGCFPPINNSAEARERVGFLGVCETNFSRAICGREAACVR